jgi:hypothetical protein
MVLKVSNEARLGQVPWRRLKISAIAVENPVERTVLYAIVTHSSECFSGLHHSRANADEAMII